MKDNDPTTQGVDAVPQDGNGADNQQQQMIPVERFNEVYREREESKRLIAEQQAALATAQATMAQLQAQQNRAPAEAPPEMDPEDAKRVGYFVNQAMAPVMAELKALRGGVHAARSAPEMEKVEAQLAQINNPAVTKRTKELMGLLQARGELGSVYTPAEVLKQAIGEFAMGEMLRGGQNQAERNQYNGSNVAPLGAGSAGTGRRAPAQQQGGSRTASVVSKPLEEMSVQELEAYVMQEETKNPDGFSF